MNDKDGSKVKAKKTKVEYDQEFRSMIHLMMFDEVYFKAHDQVKSLRKLLSALEAISWLHNCSKIQIGKGLLAHSQLSQFDYWMTVRGK